MSAESAPSFLPPSSALSASSAVADDVSLITQLQASAERFETPCGDGNVVWHAWGPQNTQHPPLVLLHGGSGSWTHWVRNIAPLVQTGRRVWVPDLPGFGDSALPFDGHDADALVAPLAAGLQQLLGGVPFDLVGFSFGGMTAGLLAAAHPKLLRQLVIAGAPGLGLSSHRTVRLRGWRHLSDPAEIEAMHRYNLLALMLYNPDALTPLALAVHTGNVGRDRMPGRRLAYTDALKKALTQIHLPVTALYGLHDALYQGKLDALEEALSVAPNFRGLQFINGAGHWLQFEQPERFDAALLRVLDREV